MTKPHPSEDEARQQLTQELRRARSDDHERGPGADLVPVEGGEPMPAEEPPAPAPNQRPTF